MTRKELLEQFQNTLQTEAPKVAPRTITKVVVCGMGGSGIVGDVLSYFKTTWNLPVSVSTHKSYGIPDVSDALFIFVSFSGNTEETLSGFAAARVKKNTLFGVVTGGGTLATEAKRFNVPRVILPENSLTPRDGIGYNTNAVLTLLHSFFPSFRIPSSPKIAFESVLQKEATKIGQTMTNTIPLIYTEDNRKVIGTIWKMYLNETAKTPAFANVLPEMNHNELQSFEGNTLPFSAIFLGEKTMPKRIGLRAEITKKILKKEGIKILSLNDLGKTPNEKFWNTVLLASYTAQTIAKKKGINPTKTQLINQLKKSLAE
jgi:glucose/mannose-6-phosphate isomerase